MSKDADDFQCSFCKKPRDQVRKIIAGESANICDECVEVCNDIIADDSRFVDATGTPVIDPAPEGVAVVPAINGLAVRCSLCHMPVPIEHVLPIEHRGALCPGCVGEIEAAIADRADNES
jgi:hypothetical protein